jgi:hypothetical protein
LESSASCNVLVKITLQKTFNDYYEQACSIRKRQLILWLSPWYIKEYLLSMVTDVTITLTPLIHNYSSNSFNAWCLIILMFILKLTLLELIFRCKIFCKLFVWSRGSVLVAVTDVTQFGQAFSPSYTKFCISLNFLKCVNIQDITILFYLHNMYCVC